MQPGGIDSQVKEVKSIRRADFKSSGPTASLTFEVGRGCLSWNWAAGRKGCHTIRAVLGCIISQYCVIIE